MNTALNAALYYREKYNFSVIPLIPGDKRPLIKWEEFQKRRADRKEIVAWFRENPNANIGIVTGAISNIGVIDIDTEEGQENIDKILPDSFLTPIQHTPRGGKHLICSYNAINNIYNNIIKNNTNIIQGTDFRGEGGYIAAAPSKNAKGVSYCWDSEINLENTPLSPIPSEYLDAINVYNGRQSVYSDTQTSTIVYKEYFVKGTRDNDLFHLANCLVKGRCEQDFITKTLEIISRNCNPPFPEKEIKAKIESALKRAASKDRNLAADVREYVLSTTGNFLSTDVSKGLQLSTREEQKNLSIILKRLSNEGLIEKYGNKNGHYRRIDDEVQEIDVFSADVTPLEIKWPLSVERFVHTHPKQLIVIAGEPNAGKSAYLLNVASLNMDTMPTTYFSSEMGAVELKSRLVNFERPLSDWSKLKFYERASNFADVIKPNGLNIIDFLEVHDEFYKVGGMMKAIFDKLDQGIAVIAIQKPKGRDEGLGGDRGLEKPRLYMAMSPGELKIVKGKNWVDPMINPNGMKVNWKLVQGCKFIQSGNWSA